MQGDGWLRVPTAEGKPGHSIPWPVVGLALLAVFGGATLVLVLTLNTTTPAMDTGDIDEMVPVAVTADETDPDTIEQDAALVAEAILSSEAPWSQHVRGLMTYSLLRRHVIEVETDIEGESAEATERFVASLQTHMTSLRRPNGTDLTYWVRVFSAESELMASFARTDERWTLESPPAPHDAVSLSRWLEEVYGGPPLEEAFLRYIIAIGDPADDPDGYLPVKTSLDPSDPADVRVAQDVFDAINSSEATFADGIRLTFGDGVYEWVSVMDGVDRAGPQ